MVSVADCEPGPLWRVGPRIGGLLVEAQACKDIQSHTNLQADSPLAALPDLPGLAEALPSGSQSSGWLPSCLSEVRKNWQTGSLPMY